MEPRTIRVVNNRNQSQVVIEGTTLETLGELKEELSRRGMDCEGLSFYCGELHSELLDDAAIIPEKGKWKGVERPVITFLLTQPEKKVASGALTRAEIYDIIKKEGLQDTCKNTYGKNFTQCSTADLEALVVKHTDSTGKSQEFSKDTTICPELKNIAKAIEILNNACYNEDVVSREEHSEIDKLLNIINCGDEIPGKKDVMSPYDIEDMFGGWAK